MNDILKDNDIIQYMFGLILYYSLLIPWINSHGIYMVGRGIV